MCTLLEKGKKKKGSSMVLDVVKGSNFIKLFYLEPLMIKKHCFKVLYKETNPLCSRFDLFRV